VGDKAHNPPRYEFGRNWQGFLSSVNEDRVGEAVTSLRAMLKMNDLRDNTFLDVGSGSGLFSLAARRLGAQVFSFDYDPLSVSCTESIKRSFSPGDPYWRIERGSILDDDYVSKLGTFDVVYSWGVLHHTGDMWKAMEAVAGLVNAEGRLFIAIYNDQGCISKYWSAVKQLYNKGVAFKYLMTAVHFPYLFLGRFALRAFTGRLNLERGMSLWYDMHDWLGGYPFEVATPDEILGFYSKRGFSPVMLVTCHNRHGCNEFVFERKVSSNE
jgi:2-polyprenyl-6-hydroxyphenyl methylase/3-demethylubiquinone-9 3-methyltransferase